MNFRIRGSREDGFFAHGESGAGDVMQPCPFCGSDDVHCENTHTPFYAVRCEVCGCEGPLTPPPVRRQRKVVTRTGCQRQHTRAAAAAMRLWNARVQ